MTTELLYLLGFAGGAYVTYLLRTMDYPGERRSCKAGRAAGPIQRWFSAAKERTNPFSSFLPSPCPRRRA